jgi:mannose-1-phosphate guanylyltransferase/mannose-6-phosphate isomerase
MLYPIILAGGGGTRLAPLSTEDTPKQFITLVGENSLLQTTFKRLASLGEGQIFISSSLKYKEKILQQLPQSEKNLILEPARKNTAPAIALIAKTMEAQGVSDDDLLLLSPADHIITPQSAFEAYIHAATPLAQQGNIVLFGIPPTTPETGYGYIKVESAVIEQGMGDIVSFTEKPTLEKAESYLASGDYLRNSGIFFFSLGTIKQAFQRFCPDLYQAMSGSLEDFIENFEQLTPISIDYAVMEKADNLKMCVMKDVEWWDIGDWERLRRFYEKYPMLKPESLYF